MVDMAQNRMDVAARLRAHDITPTHQRIEIARVLLARPQHLSADQILSLVNGQHAEVSKATVYNTLRLMVDKGLVREVIVDPTRVFYDSNTAEHFHLYDVRTGELTDIGAPEVRVVGLPALPQGTVAEGIDVVIRVRSSDPAAGSP